uniref:Golgi apparatus protein 1 n=1 Tax=Dicentrarchus labrax TaxID=13489 RepID=A0A8C4HM05_DICLA
MAAYSRTQLLLLLLPLSLLCLCGFGSVLGLKAASGPAEPPNPPVLRAADPPAKDAPAAAAAAAAAAAGASPPRRATGWKLSEEEACREDLTRLCPKHTWTNNLAVLECLQDRREETDIAPDCNHLLWNYKLNLTTDPKFESVATEVCKKITFFFFLIRPINLSREERGRGYLVSCLVDHRGNISEYQCNQYITKMTSIIFSDYRLICGFMDKCKEDINTLRCGSINIGHKDVHSQGEVIACLERALVREAEQQDHVRPIKEECQRAILRVAELSSDDFHLDRHLYFSCRDDRERFCQNTQAGEGKVYKCLFNHKFEEAMSEKCRDALTTRQKLISQDYRVSYSLAKACKLDLRKQRCSLDTNLPRAREARLSYLLLCLEAAVHRGRPVSGECQGEMLDYRRMLMEDFSLSPEIVLHCRTEIEAHCSGLHRKGRTLHCLMRIGRGDRSTTVDSVCQSALQTLIQSADPGADYRIDRALNEACESVIQTACKHIRNGDPMILSCLMEHLYTEKMVEDCEHRLLELQYFISRDWK